MESSQRIKFYRKKKNMTQDQLAEALEVVPAMMIQCDDIVRKDVKSYQIMKDLEDCSDYELSVIHDILLSLKSSLRENYSG